MGRGRRERRAETTLIRGSNPQPSLSSVHAALWRGARPERGPGAPRRPREPLAGEPGRHGRAGTRRLKAVNDREPLTFPTREGKDRWPRGTRVQQRKPTDLRQATKTNHQMNDNPRPVGLLLRRCSDTERGSRNGTSMRSEIHRETRYYRSIACHRCIATMIHRQRRYITEMESRRSFFG